MFPTLTGTIASRFEILSRLGTGGMGVVYEALDHERGTKVALKTLVRAGPSEVHQLKREFRAIADIVHPNLVELHELISAPDCDAFFTMELVTGADFLRYVRSSTGPEDTTPLVSRVRLADEASRSYDIAPPYPGGALDEARLREALAQLVRGLGAIHRAGKIHRDLKPSNVLVREDGRLVILDFGLARSRRAMPEDEDVTMAFLGTPAYMSPEQASAEELSPASDFYAVGVMLYEALTGVQPFRGRPYEILLKKRTSDPPSPLAIPYVARYGGSVPRDLVDLCMRLLDRTPAKRPQEHEILTALGEPPTTKSLAIALPDPVFVGREEESSTLAAAVARLSEGGPVVVTVCGRSGMGKSALVERLLESFRSKPESLVLRGRCYERESVPYKSIDGVLDSLGHNLSFLPPSEVEALVSHDLGALTRVFPSLLRVPTIAAIAQGAPLLAQDDREARWRAFSALKVLVGELSRTRTVVVHIDDLQWGDADGTSALVELLRPPDAPRFVLVASYRSEEAARSEPLRTFLAELDGPSFQGVRTHVDVAPLTTPEAYDLARALLLQGRLAGTQDDVDRIARTIAQESAGSPYFVGELSHAALRGEGPDVSLSRLLDARVVGLAPDARRLLAIVSTAGSPLAQDVAADAADVPDPRAALAMLRFQRLVRARGLSDHDAVESYHDRIREHVVRTMPDEERAACHRRLAISLDKYGSEDPERLAEHWLFSGDAEKAGDLYEHAAHRAAQALAFDRAARLYARAAERPGLRRARLELLESRRGEALANAGRGTEAAAAFLSAATYADTDRALELRRLAGERLLAAGHVDQGLEVLREVLRELDLWMPSSPQLALLSFLVRRAELGVRGLEFREKTPEEVKKRDRLRIDTCWALTVGLNGVDMMRGADFAARSLLLSLRAGDPFRIGRALAFETTSTAFVGTTNEARADALAKSLLELADRLRDPHLLGFGHLVTGMCDAFTRGRWTSALEHYAKAEKVFRDECRGVSWEVDTTDMVTSWSLFYTGRLRELSARLPATLKAAEQRRDLYAQANLTTSHAWVMLARGDIEAARAQPALVMARWSSEDFHLQHYVALLAETYVARYAAEGNEAYERIAAAFPALESSLLLRAQNNRIVAHYERGLSAVAAAATRREAKSHLLAVAKHDAHAVLSERAAWARPSADLILAGAAALEGRDDDAVLALGRAETSFRQGDMKLYAAAARTARGQRLGGASGEFLVRSAAEELRAEGVSDPSAFAAMLAPGFRA